MNDNLVKGSAYFPSIDKKYGQPIAHWHGLLGEFRAANPGVKHMQQVAWLKEEHGMGHGHANAIVVSMPPG